MNAATEKIEATPMEVVEKALEDLRNVEKRTYYMRQTLEQ